MQTGVQTRARCNSFGPPLTDPTSRMITRWKPKQSNMVLKINLQRDGKCTRRGACRAQPR